jgi:ATP-dependent DNA helicase RecG
VQLRELEDLVQQGETAKVDLKQEYRLDVGNGAYRAKKRLDLAWDVAALANTRGAPGYLIIGIDEHTGQPSPDGAVGITADQIQTILTTHCQPPVHVEVQTVRWATGEPILVVTVPRSDRKPHVVRELGCPIRRGATTDHASHHELLEMAQETGGLDFGHTLVRTASLDDLDPHRVAAFVEANGQPLPDRQQLPVGVLAGHGLVRAEDGRTYPTAGAILLLGRSPQAHFPQATLSLVHYPTEDGVDPLDSLVAGGTLIEQVVAAEQFFRRNLAQDYPIEVFREAVVNALMHRDYAVGWAETTVRLRGNTVEVGSPGLLIGGLEVRDLASGPIDHPPRRNPSLVNLFFAQTRGVLGGHGLYLERAGSGLNRMRERLAEAGLPPPAFAEDEARGLFLVALQGVPVGAAATPRAGDAAELNPRQRQFLEQLRKGEEISAQEYQERFGVSRATASADLAALVRAGHIRAFGRGRSQRYG